MPSKTTSWMFEANRSLLSSFHLPFLKHHERGLLRVHPEVMVCVVCQEVMDAKDDIRVFLGGSFFFLSCCWGIYFLMCFFLFRQWGGLKQIQRIAPGDSCRKFLIYTYVRVIILDCGLRMILRFCGDHDVGCSSKGSKPIG